MLRARIDGWLPYCRRLQVLHVVLSLLLPTARCVEDATMIALTLPHTGTVVGANDTDDAFGGHYFPLANAVQSAMRLAVDDVNSLGSLLEGTLSLALLEVNSIVGAVEGLCEALQAVGDNGTYGVVAPLVSSQASALEVVSNGFFALPMMTPSGSAARATSYGVGGVGGTTGGSSFLFGIQPDIFEQMNALVRLILDMKMERDTERGWYFTQERVFVLHTYDQYGAIAAAAFSRAARQTIGINVGFNAAGHEDSTIDIVSLTSIAPSALADFQAPLLEALNRHASIMVLLTEGYDGELIRKILSQARDVGMVNEHVQWYLNDVSVMDGVFTVNDTYHDSQLAYDMRGLLGVRACPPTQGLGAQQAANLTTKWGSLDGRVHPGAGPGTLTPDGRIDPLIAFTYDSVFAMAMAIGSVQQTANNWGGELNGFVGESCPFSTDDMWEPGYAIRSAALDGEFTGVTGNIRFESSGYAITSGAGTAGTSWRKLNGTTFCALNLQAHASLGGTFVAIKEWRPDLEKDLNDTNGFENMSDFQKNQTYPSGASVYPFDRPTLRGRHLMVVTEAAAIPFVVLTGLANNQTEYGGITLDMLKILSTKLGFTYNVTAVNASVPTSTVIDYVVDGTFDMVASWTTITASRLELVAFSFPFYKTGLSFVYRPDVVTKVSYWKMFQPFEIPLWGAIFVSTAAVFLLLWLYDGDKSDQFARKEVGKGKRRQIMKGISLTSYVTGALLLGQMSHEPETLESFIITSGWIFACFILGASFTAELASFLSAEKANSLSFGLDDLRNGAVPNSQVALRQGTAFQEFYETEIMKCYSVAECNSGNAIDIPIPCYSLEECFDLVQNGTVKATIEESVTAEYRVSDDFCGLDMLPDTFNPQHYGLVLPKGTPYLEELEQAILNLEEDGTLGAISEPYFDTSRCAYLEDYEADRADSQNLTLIDMGGVFLVLGIFVAGSFVVWIFRRSPPAKMFWKWCFARRAATKTTKVLGLEEETPLPEESAKGLVPEPPLQHVLGNNAEDDSDTRVNSWPIVPLRIGDGYRHSSPEVVEEWEKKTPEEDSSELFERQRRPPVVPRANTVSATSDKRL